MAKQGELRILGVMTGTSCDGLDAACIRVDDEGWDIDWAGSREYPASLRKRVLELQKPKSKHSLSDLLTLNRDLGRWYGIALNELIQTVPTQNRPDVIANHGQTVGHFPNLKGGGVTCQLGDPTAIATATGLTVISNFREGDMSAGGQGAPLVPLFHQMLAERFSGGKGGIAIHNIGGISNLTYIGPNGEILAFDTGPGNAWIDAAAEKVTRGKAKMDKNGNIARKGVPNEKVLRELLKHPFFKMRPPKSTGRDDFPVELFLKKFKKADPAMVTTATILTVETIAQSYERFILNAGLPLQRIYVCGGGAKNPMIVEGLKIRIGDLVDVAPLDETGIDSQFIEALAFAVFGYLSLMGNPIGGSWTGAKRFGAPGHIIPGPNWGDVLGKIGVLA